MLAVLLLNILVIGRSFELFTLPGEKSTLESSKEAVLILVDYVQRLAQSQGLGALPAVHDMLARFQYDIKRAKTIDELAQAVISSSREASETIDLELDGKRRELLQTLISRDPMVPQIQEKVSIVVANEDGSRVEITDQAQVLSDYTKEQIRMNPMMSRAFEPIVVEINEGKAQVVNYRSYVDRINALQSEVQNMQAELRAVNARAGYLPLTGAGVEVKVYDAPGGYTDQYIVHDADVRDIVNELIGGGAVGVAVGGQRMTIQTAIRCTGPVVLVNQKQIDVNPVVIHAVGDPRVLESSLDLMKNTLLATRGIELTVTRVDEITLPAAPKQP